MSPNINISKHHKKIAIVAGEKSGDELGAPLMESIRRELPDVEFIGLGGESMKKKGLESFFDIKEIAVMGIIEPLFRLRKILKLRKPSCGALKASGCCVVSANLD